MRSAVALVVALAAVAGAGPLPSYAGGEEAPAASAPAALAVSFKLDPRLSGPTYGGERWVSPPTYTGASGQVTVEARALAADARGRPLKSAPEWTPSDPEMVAVSPPRGEQVRLTVKRAGESSVIVTSGGASRKLTVKAVQANGIWRVDVSQ
ncbi:MAG TPA: hypothetical protein VIW03_15855 [Anaeromyxobacter sp.]